MKLVSQSAASERPSWDGGRVLFEIKDGEEHIPCAISRGALEEISGIFCGGASRSLSSFVQARPRIEALALEKLRSRPAGVSGRINLWIDDLYFLPPDMGPGVARLEISLPQTA